LEDIAGWVAPAATMIAAVMTAANLGARVTGWGFVVFVIGSISWSIVGISSGQSNLLWTNGFLTLVNAMGVWRWLGRQAKYDDGGAAAAERSARGRVPTLFSAGSLVGSKVTGKDGNTIGVVVDAMARCQGAVLAYIVVSEGGVGGVGERLHALDPAVLVFDHDSVVAPFDANDLAALPALDADRWPERLETASA
jgi:hypothetical protein